MPYNVVCVLDEKASIAFAATATDALALVDRRTRAGAADIDVVSTEGARLPLDWLRRIAEHERADAVPPR
ncbi:hypothetical protein GCM10008171_13010 [Methylopila jiangsuensis]|uniref:Uncharacterized protein n=1 Tax=Methylopila jiangsuensis TaxID=586230 RepID=A0A9W6N3G7_9HYPH|nr:hypothetical protein [Methylopila jiangsuensis]MDR6286284.1 hypothetical protein [Methylopila jiangsuensis]GLK76047.1 hypothetical protein GCM10008171_13010 [Methylopila jiangsuensis]